jgi:hypothetical protein
MLNEPKRLYLCTGDVVYHLRYRAWGVGRVVELMTSTLPGGAAFARIVWNDGKKRVFNNDLDHYQCCYFFGVRLSDSPIQAPSPREPRRTRLLAPSRH